MYSLNKYPKEGIAFKIADCSHVISCSCVQSKRHDAHVSPLSLDRYLGLSSGKFELGAVLPDMEEQFSRFVRISVTKHRFEFLKETLGIAQR